MASILNQLLLSCIHNEIRREILLDVVNETDNDCSRGVLMDEHREPLGVHLEVDSSDVNEVETVEVTALTAPQGITPYTAPSTEFVLDKLPQLVVGEGRIESDGDGGACQSAILNTQSAGLD